MARQKRNFVVKTIDGRGAAVQKALKAAGIEVVSVFEIYKEELPEDPQQTESDGAETAAPAKDAKKPAPESDGGSE